MIFAAGDLPKITPKAYSAHPDLLAIFKIKGLHPAEEERRKRAEKMMGKGREEKGRNGKKEEGEESKIRRPF